jgi:hypothetical protein
MWLFKFEDKTHRDATAIIVRVLAVHMVAAPGLSSRRHEYLNSDTRLSVGACEMGQGVETL